MSSSTSSIYLIFSSVGSIWPKKKQVYIGVLVLNKILRSVLLVDILSKTMKELYWISSVACNVNCIFREVIPYYWIFYIKKMKSALLILYVINNVFSASNIL